MLYIFSFVFIANLEIDQVKIRKISDECAQFLSYHCMYSGLKISLTVSLSCGFTLSKD